MTNKRTSKRSGQAPALTSPVSEGKKLKSARQAGIEQANAIIAAIERKGSAPQIVKPEPKPTPFQLTLTTHEGELLEQWQIDYDIEDDPNNVDIHDLAYPLVRGEVIGEVVTKLRARKLKGVEA